MEGKVTAKIQDAELGKGWYKITLSQHLFTTATPDADLIAYVRRACPQATAVQIIREYPV